MTFGIRRAIISSLLSPSILYPHAHKPQTMQSLCWPCLNSFAKNQNTNILVITYILEICANIHFWCGLEQFCLKGGWQSLAEFTKQKYPLKAIIPNSFRN